MRRASRAGAASRWSDSAFERYLERTTRLCEQGRGAEKPALRLYVLRWERWATGGLAGCPQLRLRRYAAVVLVPAACVPSRCHRRPGEHGGVAASTIPAAVSEVVPMLAGPQGSTNTVLCYG